MSIQHVASGFDVSQALKEIDANPQEWNRHRMRTEAYATPHKAVSDMWIRYNDWANFDGDPQAFNGPHESVWYPVVTLLPSVWSLARKVMRHVGGKQLGGVLITKIPPGGEVKPHVDHGWHAQHYRKYAVQLRGNAKQAFCFEDSQLSAEPGDLYTFDNSKLHWVTNASDEDRITLIVCVA